MGHEWVCEAMHCLRQCIAFKLQGHPSFKVLFVLLLLLHSAPLACSSASGLQGLGPTIIDLLHGWSKAQVQIKEGQSGRALEDRETEKENTQLAMDTVCQISSDLHGNSEAMHAQAQGACSGSPKPVLKQWLQ